MLLGMSLVVWGCHGVVSVSVFAIIFFKILQPRLSSLVPGVRHISSSSSSGSLN